MNDTMNPEGLVPSLLVFGTLPRFYPVNTVLPEQQERMRALEMARAEMATISAALRLQKALLANIPAACAQSYKIGQKVMIFREGQHPPWTGPYHVTNVTNKQNFIDRDGKEVQHSISQVKPYIENLNEVHFSTL